MEEALLALARLPTEEVPPSREGRSLRFVLVLVLVLGPAFVLATPTGTPAVAGLEDACPGLESDEDATAPNGCSGLGEVSLARDSKFPSP